MDTIGRMEDIETAAVESLVAAASPAVAESLGLAQTAIAGAFCTSCAAAPGSRELNHVHRLGADGKPVDEAVLDEIASWYAQRSATYVVGIAPHVDAGLAAQLAERGFTPSRTWSKFVYDGALAEPAPATDLDLGVATGEEFGRVTTEGFGFPSAMAPWTAELPDRPGWTCLVARDDDGAALGAGALFISGPNAWLGFGATLPAARGRGAQRALLARRIAIALERGCDLITTETGAPFEGGPQQSHRNIERAGFRVEYGRPHLASPGFPA